MPLVLSRGVNESIVIGDDIVVTAVTCTAGRVKLHVDAPREVKVMRAELLQLQPRPELPPSVKVVRDKMIRIAKEWGSYAALNADAAASSCLDDMHAVICDARV